MPDELVFSVEGSNAVPASPITLAEAGLVERQHLQEWVLAHPEIIGDSVLVVSSEFDSWRSASGAERDRLDVLCLDPTGRLVVVELKRDRAPDTVEMQAIKYAAMASRFSSEVVASQYAEFLRRRGDTVSDEEAMAKLVEHVGGELDPDLLRQPRIVLVATAFPPTVTATVVWLSEMGLDVSLVKLQAYRVDDQRVIVSVSQLYPVSDVEEFTVAPVRASARRTRGDDYPELPWDGEDLQRFADVVRNPTVLAAMALCAERPDSGSPSEKSRRRPSGLGIRSAETSPVDDDGEEAVRPVRLALHLPVGGRWRGECLLPTGQRNRAALDCDHNE